MKKITSLILSVIILAVSLFTFASCSEPQMVVVGYTIYAPMNYLDENDTLVGFDTELAEAVFKKLGCGVTFKEIEWDKRYIELESGTINCIWNGFTANTADNDGILRSEKVDFSYNYMLNKQVLVVKGNKEIASAEDLKGLKVFAESGSAGETYAGEFKGATVKGVKKQTDCLMEIASGAADAAVLDAQLAKSYVGKGDYADLEIVEALSSAPEYYAIGFRKGDALTAEVNKALEELAADGTIEKLAKKYGVENSVITDFADQK